MAAAVTESKTSRSLVWGSVVWGSLVHRSTLSTAGCVVLLLCVMLGGASADNVYEMEEFLKREYSLTKPYQGKTNLILTLTLTDTLTISDLALPR